MVEKKAKRPKGCGAQVIWEPALGSLTLIFFAGCRAHAHMAEPAAKEGLKAWEAKLSQVTTISVPGEDGDIERWEVITPVEDILQVPHAGTLEDELRGAVTVLYTAEHTAHRGTNRWFPFKYERWSPRRITIQFSDGNVWQLT